MSLNEHPLSSADHKIQFGFENLRFKLSEFEQSMHEFKVDAICGSETLLEDKYMSSGFFESCMCVHILLLKKMSTFVRPQLLQFDFGLVDFEEG